jgi:hypothetical protein
MTTAQNQADLLKIIPNLMGLVTKAQAHLASIESHLELAQDGVLRSSLYPINDEPQFTQNFEDSSGEFLVAVDEVSKIFTSVAESIEQIEASTYQIVVGVKNLLQGEEDIAPLPKVLHAVH